MNALLERNNIQKSLTNVSMSCFDSSSSSSRDINCCNALLVASSVVGMEIGPISTTLTLDSFGRKKVGKNRIKIKSNLYKVHPVKSNENFKINSTVFEDYHLRNNDKTKQDLPIMGICPNLG